MASYANPFGNTQPFRDWLRLLQNNPIDYTYYNSSPAEVFGVFANLVGEQGSKNFEDWLRRQFERYYSQYNTIAAVNPAYQWFDFLTEIDPSREFSLSDFYERGERPGGFAPTMRMVW